MSLLGIKQNLFDRSPAKAQGLQRTDSGASAGSGSAAYASGRSPGGAIASYESSPLEMVQRGAPNNPIASPTKVVSPTTIGMRLQDSPDKNADSRPEPELPSTEKEGDDCLHIPSRLDDLRACFSKKNILMFAPTGFLRAIEDSLTIVVINFISPSGYMVMSQSRLILTGLMAKLCLGSSPNQMQWHGLFIIATGMISFKFAKASGKEEDDEDSQRESDKEALGLVLLAIAVVCKVMASVWLEYALKKGGAQSVIIQSANISFATIIPAFVFAAFHANWVVNEEGVKAAESQRERWVERKDGSQEPGAYEHEASLAHVYRNWSGLIVFLLFYLLAKNWLSNLIVKRFSAVVKYVVYATAVVLTYLFESSGLLGIGGNFGLSALFATFVVMQGVILFADAKKYKRIVKKR